MITAAQLRAARGLVDWTRNELAKAANISPETVKNIEHGIFRPQEETAERIVRTFAAHDVEFTADEGVRFNKQAIKTFIGQQGYIDFLKDILGVMRAGGVTRQFNFSDEIISGYGGEYGKEFLEAMKAKTDLDARCLVPEGDLNLPAKYCQYKWLPKVHKDIVPYYLYNDRIAVMTNDAQHELSFVVISSKTLADAYLRQFDFFWQNGLEQVAAKGLQKSASK